jgi:phosphotransferase system enzyme I (PtsI)
MTPESPPTEKIWRGQAVSGGVAHAAVHVFKDSFDEPDDEPITADEVEGELARWHRALAVTRQEIEELQAAVSASGETTEADIFETHLLILQDASILKQVEKLVREKLVRTDAVYYRLMCKNMEALRRLPDPYLRERYMDIKDVTQRVMRHLRGEMLDHPMFEDPVIILARDLTPSDTVQLDRSRVLGFATETGSSNSHAAIIARSLGLPAVVRLHGICEELHSGDVVLLDGDEGVVILNPSPETIASYRSREEEAEEREDALLAERHAPSVTCDGCDVTVSANAEFVEEVSAIRDSGAHDVGLFRTEFLHLEDPGGSEDWLTNCYSKIVAAMRPGLVTFRTLDIGGDKIHPPPAEPEPNPFLGWRGIRLTLGMPALFKRQLRAMLRAAAHGQVAIMFPMVSGVDEVRQAKALLEECARELVQEGHAVPDEIEVGAMIEIPSAALAADVIAAEVDFFSLGTNDLTQYTLAVDRLNERVAYLYEATHPAVLRLIALTIAAARRAGIRVCLCGEMGSDLELTPLLIGMGLNEISVAVGQVARVKHAVRKLHAGQCEALAEAAQKLGTAAAIRELSRVVARERYPELFD